jgi:endonuclease G
MAAVRQIALLAALASALAAQPGRFGAPACAGDDQELADRSFFLLCHSASRKVPLWVGYELTPSRLAGAAVRSSHFRADRALARPGARDSDYKGSGFSRGHLAPAADFAWSDEAVRATFLLSNVAPQLQQVNAGVWARLEHGVRRLAAAADAVYVFSGPVFAGEPAVIGAGRVAVPAHFFKTILVVKDGQRTMYGALIPNRHCDEPLSHFSTSVEEIERRTGLNFFNLLEHEEQETLESARPLLPDARAQ